MVSCDGAGASHGLINRLDQLACRPGYQLTHSVGWDLGVREREAISRVPEGAWQVAIDHRGQLRERRTDDACADRCAGMCGAGAPVRPTSTPPIGSMPGSRTPVRAGKDCGIGRFPSHDFAINSAWPAAALMAATLLAWLRLLALEGELARAEPKNLAL